MNELMNLYFGKDDAESDISSGGLLTQGFLRTAAYNAAIAGRKMLIIGRKGSGKSAICLMIHKAKENSANTCLITPDEISSEEIRRFTLSGIARQEAKSLIWRYIFNIQISKYIVNRAKDIYHSSADFPSEIKSIRQFLVDNKEVDDINFTDRFWKIIEKIQASISLDAFGVSIESSVEAKDSQSDGIRIDRELDIVEENISKAFNVLSSYVENNKFIMLVDQLEKVWSNNRDSDLLVIGLLTAAKRISSMYDNVLCTIFLRTDIYELLQFQDRDKFRGDEMHIDWNANRMDELILARAKASLNKTVDSRLLWNKIFPSHVDGTATDQFLIQRTLMRPRDIIQLCNACRDVAEKNAHEAISADDLKEAYALYSNWKLSDLINEYRVNHPFLSDLFVLFTNRGYLLSRKVLEVQFYKIQQSLQNRYLELSNIFSLDGILEILYSIGFLGVIRNSDTRYVYEDKNVIEVHETQFLIHPCFRAALRSTASVDVTPYESNLDIENYSLPRYMHRLHAEMTPSRAVNISSRGSRPYRTLEYVEEAAQMVNRAFIKSSLPDEITHEIRHSLSEYRKDLMKVREFGIENPMLITEMTTKMLRYLQHLSATLSERELLDKKLGISLDESIYTLTRIRDGILDEFI